MTQSDSEYVNVSTQDLAFYKRFQQALLIIWFVGCSALILIMNAGKAREFDPEQRLAIKLMELDLEAKLLSTLNTFKNNSSRGRIFHLYQNQCICERLAKSHVKTLDSWASDNRFESHSVNINQYPQLKAFVPSTPAILAIDANNQLIYFGPYSRGIGCFNRSGEIDQQLANWVTPNSQRAGIIETDAKGCYCAVDIT